MSSRLRFTKRLVRRKSGYLKRGPTLTFLGVFEETCGPFDILRL